MIYDAIIIGSGVAGLTAGLYLARAKKSVMIIEDSVLGGTTATLEKIENYPGFQSISGMELVQNMIMQVTSLGVNIDFLTINNIDFDNKTIKCGKIDMQYRALIIASGTSHNKLNLPEEDKYKFKGLSYCAVCDGSLYKGKTIIVAINGNSGIDTINYLKNITNDIIVIDSSDTFKDNNVKVYNNSNIIGIYGEHFIESVEVINNNNQFKIQCDALFVALGKNTNLSLFKEHIKCDDMFILSDENMHTNIDGVFVAGDVRKKSFRQIITACSDGAIAANEAIKYLSANQVNN